MNSAIHDQNVAQTGFSGAAHQPIKRRELIDVAMGKTPAETVIQGGRLVNVATAEIYPADVAIKGGRIAAVGDVAYTKGPKTRVIDATGRFITPGLVEGHLHQYHSYLGVTEYRRGAPQPRRDRYGRRLLRAWNCGGRTGGPLLQRGI